VSLVGPVRLLQYLIIVHFYEQINNDNDDDTFTQWQTLNVHDVSYAEALWYWLQS